MFAVCHDIFQRWSFSSKDSRRRTWRITCDNVVRWTLWTPRLLWWMLDAKRPEKNTPTYRNLEPSDIKNIILILISTIWDFLHFKNNLRTWDSSNTLPEVETNAVNWSALWGGFALWHIARTQHHPGLQRLWWETKSKKANGNWMTFMSFMSFMSTVWS